jgi:hypothetical protein
VASESGAWWLRWRDAYPCGRWFRAVKRDDDGCIEDWEWGHKEDRTSFPTRAEAERAARTEYAGRHNWVGGWKHGMAIMRPKRRAAAIPVLAVGQRWRLRDGEVVEVIRVLDGGAEVRGADGYEYSYTARSFLNWTLVPAVAAAPLSPVPSPVGVTTGTFTESVSADMMVGETSVHLPVSELHRWAACDEVSRGRVIDALIDHNKWPLSHQMVETRHAALALLRAAAGSAAGAAVES